jgi:hypothetical protein
MFRSILIASALMLSTTLAFAGAWPEAGDQFMTSDGSVLVVLKVKVRTDVDESFVCMHRSGTRAQDKSCVRMRVGSLIGNWITYEGISQKGAQ